MTAPFQFSISYQDALASGLHPETVGDVTAGDIVRVDDGRLARFVAVDTSGPHRIPWVSIQGVMEFARMLARARDINDGISS